MISNRQKFASCIIDKLSVYELLKFLQYAILCCTCGNYSFLSYNNSSFDFPHLCIHKDTHTHTHTHACKIRFLMKSSDLVKILGKSREINKYLHYLSKMIEKCKMKKFIFTEVSFFRPELFQRFCLDFKWLNSSFGIHWTPFIDIFHSEAAIRNLGKILKKLQGISFLDLMKLNASNWKWTP